MNLRPPAITWIVFTAILAIAVLPPAGACTRSLYVGDEDTVITGRNMDWEEDLASNLYIFPAGMKRDGASGGEFDHLDIEIWQRCRRRIRGGHN